MTASVFVSPNLGNGDRIILGEGPFIFQGKLVSTDAHRCLLRWTDLETGVTENVDIAAHLKVQGHIAQDAKTPILGCAAPTTDDRLIVATSRGIYLFDPASKELVFFSHPEDERVHLNPHYNDGKAGPDGAFYVGGMIGDQPGAGRLLRIAPSGEVSEPLVDGPPLTTPNGLHWFPTADPDLWEFYYVCSQYPAIQHYQHRLSAGKMFRQPDLIDLPLEEFGYLDGMTGSQNGLLFLALWEAQEYGCIIVDVATRTIIDRISTDAPQTSSAALVNHVLYMTSATAGYSDQKRDKYPNAGAIYRCDLNASTLAAVREAEPSEPFKFSITNVT